MAAERLFGFLISGRLLSTVLKPLLAVFVVCLLLLGIVQIDNLSYQDIAVVANDDNPKVLSETERKDQSPSEIFQNRQRRLDGLCRKQQSSSDSFFPRPLNNQFPKVFSHKSFIFCSVAKSGCTFWKRMFRFANDTIFNKYSSPWDIDRYSIHFAGSPYGVTYDNNLHSPSVFPHRLLVSRDPFSRVLSSYVDKFYLPDFWYMFSGNPSLIQAKYIQQPQLNKADFFLNHFHYMSSFLHLNATPDRIKVVKDGKCAKFVTFSQFVDKLVLRYWNEHWTPASRMCDPCLFKPTYWSKMETFAQDAQHILDDMGLGKHFVGFNASAQTEQELRTITEYNFRIRSMYQNFVQNCAHDEEIAFRLWNNFRWKGYISPDVEYVIPKAGTDVKEDLLRQLASARQQGLTNPDKMKQTKRDFFKKAYLTLTKKQLEDLIRLFENDIEYFDYEKKRDEVLSLFNS